MKNTVENVLAQFFNRVFFIWCGESQWRNRPKVYEYRGSMPICIVVAHVAKASEVIDRQVYEYTAQCRGPVYEKNEKFAGL